MEQEVVVSRAADARQAAAELCARLRRSPDSYRAAVFFAAVRYDFAELSREIKARLPNTEVVGTTTAGELTLQGFANDSVVLTTMSDTATRVKAVLVEHGSRYPVACRGRLEAALRECGIRIGDANSHRDAFAVAFIDGGHNSEETVLTNFYATVRNDCFKLAGGTAGYTGSDTRTFVSANGEVTDDGAAFLLVKTSRPFDIRQESMFDPTGKSVFVTESDVMSRTIAKLDGRPAKTVYAEMLGVPEARVDSVMAENPFGRFLNGAIRISALASFTPDRKIRVYSRVVPNSTLELLHIADPLAKCDETCAGILAAVPRPKFVLLMTCITRTVIFGKMRIQDKIVRKYGAAFPTFAGFSAYGEQHGRIHCSQTLVTVAVGE